MVWEHQTKICERALGSKQPPPERALGELRDRHVSEQEDGGSVPRRG